jgi:hypothetical protein
MEGDGVTAGGKGAREDSDISLPRPSGAKTSVEAVASAKI